MARSNNGQVSAYAQYETEKGVKGIGAYVPRELYDLMNQVRPNVADGAIIKEALTEFVNRRLEAQMAPTTYVLPGRAKPETAEAKAKRELAAALEEIAQLKAQLVPTPPAMKANEKGELVKAE